MIKEYGTEEYGNNEFTLTCNKCGRSAWITPIHYYDENGLEKITLQLHCTCGNKYGATIHHEIKKEIVKDIEPNIEVKIFKPIEEEKTPDYKINENPAQEKKCITISDMVEELSLYCDQQNGCERCKIECRNKTHTCGNGYGYIKGYLPTSQEIELNYAIIKE